MAEYYTGTGGISFTATVSEFILNCVNYSFAISNRAVFTGNALVDSNCYFPYISSGVITLVGLSLLSNSIIFDTEGNIVFGSNGVPQINIPIAAAGILELSSEAEYTINFIHIPTGGCVLSNTGIDFITNIIGSIAGEFSLSSLNDLVVTRIIDITGGAILSGNPDIIQNFVHTPDGLITFGSSANSILNFIHTTTGGLAAASTAAFLFSHYFIGDGIIELNPISEYENIFEFSYISTGDAELSGNAILINNYDFFPTGIEATFGGDAYTYSNTSFVNIASGGITLSSVTEFIFNLIVDSSGELELSGGITNYISPNQYPWVNYNPKIDFEKINGDGDDTLIADPKIFFTSAILSNVSFGDYSRNILILDETDLYPETTVLLGYDNDVSEYCIISIVDKVPEKILLGNIDPTTGENDTFQLITQTEDKVHLIGSFEQSLAGIQSTANLNFFGGDITLHDAATNLKTGEDFIRCSVGNKGRSWLSTNENEAEVISGGNSSPSGEDFLAVTWDEEYQNFVATVRLENYSSDAFFCRSADGETWTEHVVQSGTVFSLYKPDLTTLVYSKNKKVLIAAPTAYPGFNPAIHNSIFWSYDNGTTWQYRYDLKLPYIINDILIKDHDDETGDITIFLVGHEQSQPYGEITKVVIGGNQGFDPYVFDNAVKQTFYSDFPEPQNISLNYNSEIEIMWASSLNGVIKRSYDFGETWTNVNLPSGTSGCMGFCAYTDIAGYGAFINSGTGNHEIYLTRDAGITWIKKGLIGDGDGGIFSKATYDSNNGQGIRLVGEEATTSAALQIMGINSPVLITSFQRTVDGLSPIYSISVDLIGDRSISKDLFQYTSLIGSCDTNILFSFLNIPPEVSGSAFGAYVIFSAPTGEAPVEFFELTIDDVPLNICSGILEINPHTQDFMLVLMQSEDDAGEDGKRIFFTNSLGSTRLDIGDGKTYLADHPGWIKWFGGNIKRMIAFIPGDTLSDYLFMTSADGENWVPCIQDDLDLDASFLGTGFYMPFFYEEIGKIILPIAKAYDYLGTTQHSMNKIIKSDNSVVFQSGDSDSNRGYDFIIKNPLGDGLLLRLLSAVSLSYPYQESNIDSWYNAKISGESLLTSVMIFESDGIINLSEENITGIVGHIYLLTDGSMNITPTVTEFSAPFYYETQLDDLIINTSAVFYTQILLHTFPQLIEYEEIVRAAGANPISSSFGFDGKHSVGALENLGTHKSVTCANIKLSPNDSVDLIHNAVRNLQKKYPTRSVLFTPQPLPTITIGFGNIPLSWDVDNDSYFVHYSRLYIQLTGSATVQFTPV